MLIFALEGLSCPSCAGKMETGLRRLEGVAGATIDFASRRLLLEADGADGALLERAGALVRGIEAHVVLRRVIPADEFAAHPPEAGSRETQGQDRGRAGETSSGKGRRLLNLCACLGALPFVAGLLWEPSSPWRLVWFLAAWLLAGGEVLYRAGRNLLRGDLFDENFLMSAATVGAFALGEYPEGVAVMLFFQLGEAAQRLAVGRARRSVADLMDIRADIAHLYTPEGLREVPPESVSVGALVAVKPGERVPLDGVVSEGRSALDMSALTGESLPRDVGPGDTALAGSINVSGLLALKVTKTFGASTVAKLLALVQDAGLRKARSERFITRFSKVYTPIVLGAALLLALLPPLLLPEASWSEWIRRALVFLVVSCPCALVLSVPLGYFAGIGGASRRGILIKGGNYLEALSRVDTVVFDKTGTLTQGAFTVSHVEASESFPAETLLDIAAHAECHSSHPIAYSVRRAYGRTPDEARVSEYTELAGRGVRALVDGRPVLAGGLALLAEAGISPPPADEGPGTAVWLAVDGAYAGRILLSDNLKPDGPEAVRALRAAGVRRVAMLTGDRAAAARPVAEALGLDDFRAELLPPQKVEEIERLAAQRQTSGSLVFVGDGLNDAPALARSDVGVAMGGIGSDAALEAADVVLMTDEPSKLAEAMRLSRRTQGIVRQNIVFALSVKGALLLLGMWGMLPMWAAVFGDVGVALLAVLNAARARYHAGG